MYYWLQRGILDIVLQTSNIRVCDFYLNCFISVISFCSTATVMQKVIRFKCCLLLSLILVLMIHKLYAFGSRRGLDFCTQTGQLVLSLHLPSVSPGQRQNCLQRTLRSDHWCHSFEASLIHIFLVLPSLDRLLEGGAWHYVVVLGLDPLIFSPSLSDELLFLVLSCVVFFFFFPR